MLSVRSKIAFRRWSFWEDPQRFPRAFAHRVKPLQSTAYLAESCAPVSAAISGNLASTPGEKARSAPGDCSGCI
jgi:hypothetical protein